MADTDRISNDNLFILKDYSTKISKVSLKKSRFKNEKDVIDFYQKESTNLEKLNKLKKNEELYESFIKYMTGKKSLPLMYDTQQGVGGLQRKRSLGKSAFKLR